MTHPRRRDLRLDAPDSIGETIEPRISDGAAAGLRLPGDGPDVPRHLDPAAPTDPPADKTDADAPTVLPLALLEHQNATRPRLDELQRWEGVVEEVREKTFLGRLIDQTADGPDEIAEFDIEDVSPGDRELVREGAIFYWSIVYIDGLDGRRTRSSILRFRRLPAWTDQELGEAAERADARLRRFNWD